MMWLFFLSYLHAFWVWQKIYLWTPGCSFKDIILIKTSCKYVGSDCVMLGTKSAFLRLTTRTLWHRTDMKEHPSLPLRMEPASRRGDQGSDNGSTFPLPQHCCCSVPLDLRESIHGVQGVRTKDAAVGLHSNGLWFCFLWAGWNLDRDVQKSLVLSLLIFF